MLDKQRKVGGLWCSEVLERLSEFVDGDLPPEAAEQLRAHVAGCDVCERFGGAFAGMVASLRQQADEGVDADVEARLLARLHLHQG